jgi:hypothetical protein
MRYFVISFLGIILFNINLAALTAQVDIPINISDGAGGNATIRFGLDSTAFDGIDPALGEQVLPPLPPVGVFDVRFNLPGSTDASLKDYRRGLASFNGQKFHELQFQVGTGTVISIAWNLPLRITGRLQDVVSGSIIDVAMTGLGNYLVTNPSIYNKLKLTVTYSPAVAPAAPVLSLPGNNTVNVPVVPTLKWFKSETATTYRLQIAANSGFSTIVYNDSTLTDSIKVYPATLLNGAQYYWRVNAKSSNGTSAWSAPWNYTTSLTQMAQVDIPINISDGAGSSTTIRFGLDLTASDVIDPSLGELVLPPLPPAGVFDARFNLPNSTDASLMDYRQGAGNFVGQVFHEIQYQVGTGTYINLIWNFPAGVKGVLQDVMLGTIINIQMSGAGSYQVTNPAIYNKLKMTLTYNGTLPVEVISFMAIVISGTINLNWKTVSEVNNMGFNVERSINKSDWTKITFVQGNQNSTSTIAYSYADKSVSQSGKYYYRLKQIDNDGSYKYSNIIEADLLTPPVFSLSQNFPNPYNPSTMIKYQIPEAGLVTLKIYDILGREVTTLVNENKIDGYYEINFDASKLPSGNYIYQLKAKDNVSNKKMLLLK